MKVVILAGGLGTRLQKYYPDTVKSMIRFNGIPFIYYQLDLLKKAGLTDIVLCTGHGSEELEANVIVPGGMNIQFSIEDRALGTGGAVKHALGFLDDTFMVMYGDSYLDFNYRSCISFSQNYGSVGTMVIYDNRLGGEPSNVVLSRGRIISYNKQHPSRAATHIDYEVTILERISLRVILTSLTLLPYKVDW